MGKVDIVEDGNGLQNGMLIQNRQQDFLGHLGFLRKTPKYDRLWIWVGLEESSQVAGDNQIVVVFRLLQKENILVRFGSKLRPCQQIEG